MRIQTVPILWHIAEGTSSDLDHKKERQEQKRKHRTVRPPEPSFLSVLITAEERLEKQAKETRHGEIK